MPSTSLNTFLPPPHISDHRQSTLIHPCRSHFQRSRKNGGQYSYSTELRRDPTVLCSYHTAQALEQRRTVLNIEVGCQQIWQQFVNTQPVSLKSDMTKLSLFFFFLLVWRSNIVYIQSRTFSNRKVAGVINFYSNIENFRKFGSSAMPWPYLNIPGTTAICEIEF